MFIGAPGREVNPTQHDERIVDDAVTSQTLTYFHRDNSKKERTELIKTTKY